MASLLQKLRNWCTEMLAKFWGEPTKRSVENQAMLDQFCATLKVVLASCRPDDPDHNPEIAGEVKTVLDSTPEEMRWLDVYQADLYLSQIRPRASLKDELTGALAGLKRVKRAKTTAFDTDVQEVQEADLTDNAEAARARALLFRVLSDRHWYASQRNMTRQIGLVYSARLFWALVFALAFFGLMISLTELLGDEADKIGWSYTGFSVAGAAGFLGAVFSMMTARSGQLDMASIEEAQLIAQRRTISLRMAIGGTAAIALYFVFESGLASGGAFPDLEALGFTPISVPGTGGPEGAIKPKALGELVPNADLCKLIIWSFLSGFSEKLVPSILNRAEATETGKQG